MYRPGKSDYSHTRNTTTILLSPDYLQAVWSYHRWKLERKAKGSCIIPV